MSKDPLWMLREQTLTEDEARELDAFIATDRTTYLREYKRKQRQQARKKGRCIICIAGKPRKGNVTCDECQTRNNSYKKASPK